MFWCMAHQWENANIEVKGPECNSAEYFYHGLNSGTQFFKKRVKMLVLYVAS